jgi:hypothetical protein
MALSPEVLALAARFNIPVPGKADAAPPPETSPAPAAPPTPPKKMRTLISKPTPAVKRAPAPAKQTTVGRRLAATSISPTDAVGVQARQAQVKGQTGVLATSSRFKPTQEQIDINSAAEKLAEIGQGALKIIAFAGAGKTSTLDLLGRNAFVNMRGTYLAFNSVIAEDARRKMPRNIQSSTIHSLAISTTGMRPGEFKNINTHLLRQVIPQDGLLSSAQAGGAHYVSQMKWIAEALKRFCISDSERPGETEIRYVLDDYIGMPLPMMEREVQRSLEQRRTAARQLLERHLLPTWEKISTEPRYYSFDSIVKSFSLSDDAVEAAFSTSDFVLLDESQDLNGMMRVIARKACDKRRILVAVGDPWQQIYTWNGAENALEYIDGDEYYLTQSFRFGNALAHVATSLLSSKPEKAPTKAVRGNPGVETEIAYDGDISVGDTVICRTNSGLLAAAIRCAKRKMSIHVLKGIDDLIAEINSGVALYENRKQQVTHSTFKCFETWEECCVVAEESKDEPLIKLIETIRSGRAKRDLDAVKAANVSSPEDADVVFGTAHKAKGSEFESVVINDDFPSDQKLAARYAKARDSTSPDRDRQIKAALEEWHVKYVALTRAMKRIIIYCD